MAPRSSAKENRTLRKKGGIFYTPPDISEFVTRNALTAYLLDQMGIDWPANADPPAFSQAILRATKSQRDLAILTLKDVKILDPACGAGALLVAACKILLEFSQLLQSKEDPENFNQKSNIVNRNIYGVDLLEENVRSTEQALVKWVIGTTNSEQERSGKLSIKNHICRGHALLGWLGDDSEQEMVNQNLFPFPWVREFPSIMNEGGFDLIVANPPYGNLLTGAETPFLGTFETLHTREIAAVFLERFFQLSRKGAQFGLIIANSIAINASTALAREIVRRHMTACRMVLFGTRPGRLFPDAEIRAMLFFGKKDCPSEHSETGIIYTTDARKFFQRERASILGDLHYESTSGIELGHRSIGDGTPEISMPKVGSPVTRQILLHLKENNSVVVGDKVNQPMFQETLEIRATGGYWLTALPKFPYRSSKIRQIRTALPLERDFLLLLVNSSLFYLYWSTYGNLRDLKISDLLKFPFPNSLQLAKYAHIIEETAKEVCSCLLKSYESFLHRKGGRRGELHPGKCKQILIAADNLICGLYSFNAAETRFILNYDAHLRRG